MSVEGASVDNVRDSNYDRRKSNLKKHLILFNKCNCPADTLTLKATTDLHLFV